jgi:hypothetical protein
MTAIAFTSHFSTDEPFKAEKTRSDDPAQGAGHLEGCKRAFLAVYVHVNTRLPREGKTQS